MQNDQGILQLQTGIVFNAFQRNQPLEISISLPEQEPAVWAGSVVSMSSCSVHCLSSEAKNQLTVPNVHQLTPRCNRQFEVYIL